MGSVKSWPGASALLLSVLGLEPRLHRRLNVLTFSVGYLRDRLKIVHAKLFKQCLEPRIRTLSGITEGLFDYHCNYEN